MSQNLDELRCVGFVRSSTVGQDVIARQSESLRAFAAQRGMKYVDEIVVNQMDGAPTDGAEDDIRTVIERKMRQADYDVLIVHDLARLGRNRLRVNCIRRMLDVAGVTLVLVAPCVNDDADDSGHFLGQDLEPA